jgi:tetratricopeptide (TPR) repeat protein
MENTDGTIIQKLWERRFFQFSFSYLLGSFALVQFSEWVVQRYGISASWPDIILLFLVCMLPSVLLFIYYHGRPGPDRVRTIEKIVFPVNLILTIGIILLVFQGQSLNRIATAVKVINEEGQEVERLVPAASITKRVAIFPLDCKGCGPEDEWLCMAVPMLMGTDLEQDIRNNVLFSFKLHRYYQNYGKSLSEKISPSLKQKVARSTYSKVLVEGEIEKNEKAYQLRIKALSTEDGSLVFEDVFTGGSVFELVDQSTAALNEKLHSAEIEEFSSYIDLPVADSYSKNEEALKSFVKGVQASSVENDYQSSLQWLERAVKLDPEFAQAHLWLANAQMAQGLANIGKTSVEAALKHSSALPERLQMSIKYHYYRFTENSLKSLKLLETWEKLYPQDYQPYSLQFYQLKSTSEFEAAAAVAERAIEQGHRGGMLLNLANLYKDQGKMEKAISYFEAFSKEFPDRAREVMALGEIYLGQGQFEKAEGFFQEQQLLNPEDPRVLLELGKTKGLQGKWQEQWSFYEEALEKASTAQDSAGVIYFMETSYIQKGQPNKAVELIEKRKQLMYAYTQPIYVDFLYVWFITIDVFVQAGRQEEVLERLIEITDRYDKQGMNTRCPALANYYGAVGDGEKLASLMEECRQELMQGNSENVFLLLEALKFKGLKDFPKAADYLDRFLEETGTPPAAFLNYLGDLYRKAGRMEDAMSFLEDAEKVNPFHPMLLLNLARVYLDTGEKEKAREKLALALEVWKDAEPQYPAAISARELWEKNFNTKLE